MFLIRFASNPIAHESRDLREWFTTSTRPTQDVPTSSKARLSRFATTVSPPTARFPSEARHARSGGTPLSAGAAAPPPVRCKSITAAAAIPLCSAHLPVHARAGARSDDGSVAGDTLEVPAALVESVGLSHWQRVTASVKVGAPVARSVQVGLLGRRAPVALAVARAILPTAALPGAPSFHRPEAVPFSLSLQVEPVGADDWEVLSLHAEYLESQLLNQVHLCITPLHLYIAPCT